MMCSNCGKQKANFIYTESINGVKKEIRLCSECAEKLGFSDITFNMPNLNFSNFFGDFLNEYDTFMPSIFSDRVKTLKCNECGMEYDEFLNTGRFGCSNCYDVFLDKIEPLLRQLHGDTKYLGKKSGNDYKKMKIKDTKNFSTENQNSNKIDVLKEQLKQAIKLENYEEAAKIRDEIKKIEESNKENNKNIENKKSKNDISNKKTTEADVERKEKEGE